MDASGLVRRATLERLADIEPHTLACELQAIVREGSMVPGVVTLRTAERLGGGFHGETRERAIGVQLTYEGLRLTRELVRNEERYASAQPTESYLALVAAEVMVSRGFGDLAETPVASGVIDLVQQFSRNQTHDYRAGNGSESSAGTTLEYDIVDLAVAAGATAVFDYVPSFVEQVGSSLAAQLEADPFSPVRDIDHHIRNGLESAVPTDDAIVVND